MANETHIDKTCFFLHLDTLVVQQAVASFYISIGLNTSMAPLATVFNAVVLFAIWRTKSLHTPSCILLGSLALSDFFVGAVTQPAYVAYKFAEVNGEFDNYCIRGVLALGSAYVFAGTSFLTLLAISIDRYLALHLGMRYRQIVTTSRVTKVVIIIWVFGCLLSSSQMFLGSKTFGRVVSGIMIFCLLVTAWAYIKSFKALKLHQAKVGTSRHASQSAYSIKDIKKYRETLTVILYIIVLVLICYIPFVCASAAIGVKGFTSATRAARNIASPISFANSFLNPIVYYWKLKDIRHACVNAVRKVLKKNEISISRTDNSVASMSYGTQDLARPEN
ncbi:melanopsin-B-like [Actinia tenebrosa]|uniref:Melanopsin-B-like n=1 Tax=Actinia tenebrosa TaxID=6105 RepID=A0A6P8H8U3_ACTTE|nr:melanopsin-B-like [Actinia tenebrosa]